MIALEVIAMPLENGLLGVKMLLVIYTVSTTETMTTAHAMHTVDQSSMWLLRMLSTLQC
jgi:hypothetical protein